MQVQPDAKRFQGSVGDAVEHVLEEALRSRSTLTAGDWLSVPHADETFRLQVTRLEPADQVSIIGELLSGHACK